LLLVRITEKFPAWKRDNFNGQVLKAMELSPGNADSVASLLNHDCHRHGGFRLDKASVTGAPKTGSS
jgi:hypothetical protein